MWRCALAWARSCLERGRADEGLAALAPWLERPATGELVWREATAMRLRLGERDGALALVEAAAGRFDLAGPLWEPLLSQVHGRVHATVRTLPEDARAVARLLALEPLPLTIPALEAASGFAPAALTRALVALHEAGLAPDGVLDPAVAEALRGELSAPLAAALHDALARALEADGAAPERVAPHLEAAGRPAGACWLAAARRTGRVDAIEAAVRTAATAAARAEALLVGVGAARRRGDLEAARAWWRQLDDHAVRTQAPGALLAAAVQGALLAAFAGDLDGAARAVASASELVGPDDPHVLAVRGALAFFAGRPYDARPLLDAGLDATDVDLRLMVLNARGALAGLEGDVALAEALHARALAEARELGRLHLAVRLLNSAGADALRRGDPGVAADRLDQARRLAIELEDREALPGILCNLAGAWFRVGALGPSRAVVHELVAEARTPRARGLAWQCRADLERAVGRFEEAAGWSDRAATAFAEAGDGAQVAVSAFNAAQARFLGTRTDEALGALRAAFAAVEALRRPDLAAARVEMALCEPDPQPLVAALPRPSSPLEHAAAARAALLRGEAFDWPDLSERGLGAGYLDALRAVATGDPDRAERVRARCSVWGDGLLASQQEALAARVEAWLRDPLRGF